MFWVRALSGDGVWISCEPGDTLRDLSEKIRVALCLPSLAYVHCPRLKFVHGHRELPVDAAVGDLEMEDSSDATLTVLCDSSPEVYDLTFDCDGDGFWDQSGMLEMLLRDPEWAQDPHWDVFTAASGTWCRLGRVDGVVFWPSGTPSSIDFHNDVEDVCSGLERLCRYPVQTEPLALPVRWFGATSEEYRYETYIPRGCRRRARVLVSPVMDRNLQEETLRQSLKDGKVKVPHVSSS
ncbi:nipblb [Symbiodinium necroappetens]|uniref:Nipblb protein n=1 Tax=Symbiodinium necroappetens TaxID=1628268 RepID=A0A812P1X9_9DINO|nr:nipblb [Symbiodinium necroappetens]